MRSWLAAVVGLGLGLGLGLKIGDPGSPTVTSTIPVPVTAPIATIPHPPVSTFPGVGGVALVWTPTRLPDDLKTKVEGLGGVTVVIEVRAGQAYLRSSTSDGVSVDDPPGPAVIPMEVIAVESQALRDLDPVGAAALADGKVLLSETSARIRRLGVGDVVTLDRDWVVGGIGEDRLYGAAEMVFPVEEAPAGLIPKYLLIGFDIDRAVMETEVRAILPVDQPLRFRGPGETPFLRHGDAVLPQAVIKEIFGEFYVTDLDDAGFRIESGWVAENIVTDTLPLIGQVSCHRAVMPQVWEIVEDMVEAGQGGLIDPAGFRGCYNPRFIAGSTMISHHTWGIALDVNYPGNEQGLSPTLDPELVERFKDAGFGWGGDWLIPDPAHFEWTGG